MKSWASRVVAEASTVVIGTSLGYDHDKYRRELCQRRITPKIARRQSEHGSGLGRARWVVERTCAWLHNFTRLLVRYDRRPRNP